MNKDRHTARVQKLIDETSSQLSDRQVRDMMFHFLGGLSVAFKLNSNEAATMLEKSKEAALKSRYGSNQD